MKIGISRFSKGLEQAREVFAMAALNGFAGVQMKPSQYEPFLKPEDFANAYGEFASLAQGGLILYPSGDPDSWMDQVLKLIPFSHAVGANHICLCACIFSSGGSEEQVKILASALTSIGKESTQQDVAISIHNHVNSIVETERDILRLLNQLDPSLCGLTYDTAHAAKSGIADLTGLIGKVISHLLNVHLKDLDAEGNFCPLGRGRLDLAPVVALLREVQFDQWLIVDDESTGYSTADAMTISREFLNRIE